MNRIHRPRAWPQWLRKLIATQMVISSGEPYNKALQLTAR
jgi:hypothetical protein